MESVRLEPLNESHLAAVAAMLADPDVLRFTRVPDPTPPDFAREWLHLYEAGREEGTREAFAALGGGGLADRGVAPAALHRWYYRERFPAPNDSLLATESLEEFSRR